MMGHYAEPPVDVILKMTDPFHTVYNMTYNPHTGEWVQRKLEDSMDEKDEREKEKESEYGKGKDKEKEKEHESAMEIEVCLSPP